jgi:hypothetical protein
MKAPRRGLRRALLRIGKMKYCRCQQSQNTYNLVLDNLKTVVSVFPVMKYRSLVWIKVVLSVIWANGNM